MQSFEELKDYIELKATEWNAIDEGECYENLWQCDEIEIEILNEVALFALSEGVVLDGVDLAAYVGTLKKSESDFESEEAWNEWCDSQYGFQNEVRDGLHLLAQAKLLPAKTQFLHDLWTQQCYPDYL